MKKIKIKDADIKHDLIVAGAPYNLVHKMFDAKKPNQQIILPENKGPK